MVRPMVGTEKKGPLTVAFHFKVSMFLRGYLLITFWLCGLCWFGHIPNNHFALCTSSLCVLCFRTRWPSLWIRWSLPRPILFDVSSRTWVNHQTRLTLSTSWTSWGILVWERLWESADRATPWELPSTTSLRGQYRDLSTKSPSGFTGIIKLGIKEEIMSPIVGA